MTEQLNREGPLPLYHQIANVIRSRIDLWEWAPGDQLVRQLPQMWRIAPTAGAQSERRTAEASQLPSR